MRINYKATTGIDMLHIQLWTSENDSIDSAVAVSQTIKKEDFIKAGNLIDRKTMPFRICYILLKGFQERVAKKILESAEYIYDEELKNSIIDYAKRVTSDDIELVPVETFKSLLKEVEDFSESLDK